MFNEEKQCSHYHQTKKKIIIIIKVLVFKFRIVKTPIFFLFELLKNSLKPRFFPPLCHLVCANYSLKKQLTQLDFTFKGLTCLHYLFPPNKQTPRPQSGHLQKPLHGLSHLCLSGCPESGNEQSDPLLTLPLLLSPCFSSYTGDFQGLCRGL